MRFVDKTKNTVCIFESYCRTMIIIILFCRERILDTSEGNRELIREVNQFGVFFRVERSILDNQQW